MDFAACCVVPGSVASVDLAPFVRTAARTSTWTVRPCYRRLSLRPQKIYGGTFLAFGRGIVAATRIPLHVTKTLETHPSPERDRNIDIPINQENQQTQCQILSAADKSRA